MKLQLRSPPPRFRDRLDAGQILARSLAAFKTQPDTVILALPRGGVPVGYAVAQTLKLPLDIFLVRKLGAPMQEELALGAIASGGVRILNEALIERLQITSDTLGLIASREEAELDRRDQLYRGDRPPLDIGGKSVILIDDGLATGASMLAAVTALHSHFELASLTIAVPIGADATCKQLRPLVSGLVCVRRPRVFSSVGEWYEDFAQVSDETVIDLLAQARQWVSAS